MQTDSNSTAEHSSGNWDLVITPQKHLFDLQLKKVWRYRDLLWLLVRRDFVAFYKQTILGPIWFFVQPIASTITYTFIFGNLAGLGTDGLPAPLFYLAGIIAWTYFSDCLLKTSTVFKDNAGIFGKVYFPRLIMPLSLVVSNLVRFAVQMILFIILMIFFAAKGSHLAIGWSVFLFPVLVMLMAAQGLGFGLLVSALTTKYRDLVMLLTFAIQLFMYTTTVVYPLSTLKGKMYTIVSLNPMTPIIEGTRKCLLGNGDFTLLSFGYAFLVTFLILGLGVITFNKVQKNFVDTI
jgi:lipopolysaccharide transport system permease protein